LLISVASDFLEFNLGQIFKDNEDKRFPKTSKMQNKSSDIVGNFNFQPNDIFKLDYDYTSGKYSSADEQVAIGGQYNFQKNFYLKFTGTKDIDTNKNIGYQYGLLYEDNCLGIDLNYYRDLTIDRDIKESDGYSFTIVLKPFGSTRSYGKNKVFGPSIN